MEVFSLILVVSVCWTRTWKAAIADSIIHIGKGVLRLLVLLDTFPALLCNLPSLGRLSSLPLQPPLSFIACSLAFFLLFCPLLKLLYNQDLRHPLFPLLRCVKVSWRRGMCVL